MGWVAWACGWDGVGGAGERGAAPGASLSVSAEAPEEPSIQANALGVSVNSREPEEVGCPAARWARCGGLAEPGLAGASVSSSGRYLRGEEWVPRPPGHLVQERPASEGAEEP